MHLFRHGKDASFLGVFMLFSSIPFLYYFLPIFLLVYWLTPAKGRNGTLLLASLLFYAWGEPKYVILMLLTIFCAWIFGRILSVCHDKGKARPVLFLACTIHIGLLAYFKYGNFVLENLNALTGASHPFLNLALPIGISFYTFQVVGYLVDIYRGICPAQHNLIDFAAYVSMFPQLIAGPIVRYSDIAPQLTSRKLTFSAFCTGLRYFILGLAKKVILANSFGEICSAFQATAQPSVLFYWLYAISFTLQIYFDFSGYSDMAIGLGKFLGFSFPENFRYPYIAKSLTEFWRRWHITLGTWFRDYVYIPLGGNRVSKGRWLWNLFVVWMLTGLWHGASWNFVLWGLWYGLFLCLEKLWLGRYLKKLPVLFQHFYVLLFVVLGFVIFDASSLSQIGANFQGLFGFASAPLTSTESLYLINSYRFLLLFGVIGCTPLPKLLLQKMQGISAGKTFLAIAEPIFLTALLFICTAYLISGSYNPFLYFRF
jgi:alginate O-acetyltransferase complex protein AlgI